MPSPIAPDIIYHLTNVSSPTISPDGSRMAFAKSHIDRETMETRSEIMMADLPDGSPARFTSGSRDGSPKFSPDGLTVAFLRPDDGDRRQIWLIPLSGGEARQLTRQRSGVSEFAWSPDSGALVFAADVDPDHVSADGPSDSSNAPQVRVVRRVRYRYDTMGWRGDSHRHLFVMGIEDHRPRQLTDGDWDDSSPAWSPDGARIAFISDRREDRDFVPYTEAYVVSAEGGEPEQWSSSQTGGLYDVGAIGWSPDGSRLVAIGSDDPDAGSGWQGWLFILEPGKAPVRLTDDSIKPEAGFFPVTPPPELRWTDDGRIIFLADARGESHLHDIPAAGGELLRVAGGGGQITSPAVDAQAQKAVVVMASPSSAGDLQLIDIAARSQGRLTDYNEGYFQEHPTARLEKFTLARGGMEIESRIFFPPGFDESKKYPLVVDIHGGPHGVFYDAFNPTQQILATGGYIVLCVNPRGSSTYGAEFMKAVMGDWGGEDYLDIMAAIDQVCARPYVDASRLGVHGYSYGGFMSSWIVGHDTRFGAAVVGAPVTDLLSMYGTSDIGVSFGEKQWGGLRKDAEAAFRDRSPITYAPRVETPVLLLHGEADLRCPIEQSEQYFVSLKRLGKEVELVRFPGCYHSFLRAGHPKMREEYLSRTLGWFDKHLGG